MKETECSHGYLITAADFCLHCWRQKDEIKKLRELIECQEKLLACYRVGLGKQPSDKLLDTITRLKKELNIK